jgi:hypothetical protein
MIEKSKRNARDDEHMAAALRHRVELPKPPQGIDPAVAEYMRRLIEFFLEQARLPVWTEPRPFYVEPEPSPPNYRPLTVPARSMITSAATDCPVDIAFHIQSDGTAQAMGSVDEVRGQLELLVRSEGARPEDVSGIVEARLARLVVASDIKLKDDPRLLERIETSPGWPARYDRALPELEPLPAVACPDCGNVVINRREQPRSGDCRACNRHFGVRIEHDEFGREVITVNKPRTAGTMHVLSDEERQARYGI